MVGYTSLKSTIFVQFLSASRGASGGPAAPRGRRGARGKISRFHGETPAFHGKIMGTFDGIYLYNMWDVNTMTLDPENSI